MGRQKERQLTLTPLQTTKYQDQLYIQHSRPQLTIVYLYSSTTGQLPLQLQYLSSLQHGQDEWALRPTVFNNYCHHDFVLLDWDHFGRRQAEVR